MAQRDLINRPRGILNKRDRKYLVGKLDEELDRDQEYQQRFRIRERLENAILDFLFFYGLNYRDIELALEKYRAEVDEIEEARVDIGDSDPDRSLALRAMFYTLFAGINPEVLDWAFAKGVHDVIWRGFATTREDLPIGEFHTQIEFQHMVSYQGLIDQYEAGGPLTVEALDALKQGGVISLEEEMKYPNVTEDQSKLPTYIPDEWPEWGAGD